MDKERMGQGKEVKTRDDPQVEIQERGDIFFFYRPKVAKEEAHSVDDLQRIYIVLRPESGEKTVETKQDPRSGKEGAKNEEEDSKVCLDDPEHEGEQGSQEVNIEKQQLMRLIVMGQKSLPDPGNKGKAWPHWGFVELVTTKPEDIRNSLKEEEYETATRGHRHNSAARAVGEGVYRILRHNPGKKMHTHLIYKLEFPTEGEKCEPQEALNIKQEGSFLIKIKNPEQSQGGSNASFRGLKKKRNAVFPAKLQGQFGKLRYHPADPPDFLNYEGCEFLMISASDDIEDELGLDLEGEKGKTKKSCSDLIKMLGGVASIKPLLEGTWV